MTTKLIQHLIHIEATEVKTGNFYHLVKTAPRLTIYKIVVREKGVVNPNPSKTLLLIKTSNKTLVNLSNTKECFSFYENGRYLRDIEHTKHKPKPKYLVAEYKEQDAAITLAR